MMKLKILIITSKFPRYKGDAQPPFSYDLARHLLKEGCEVHVIAPHDFKAKKTEVFDGIYVYRFRYFFPTSMQKVAYGPGIPDNIKNSFLAKIQALPFTISEILLTKKIVKKINPDIIHAHWAFPQGLAAMLSGKPYITTIYGGEVFMAKKYHLVKTLDKIIRKSKRSFSITRGLRAEMRRAGIKSEIGIMPLGVDIETFHPGVKGDDKIREKYCKKNEFMILNVARLVEKKGQKYLLEAFSQVIREVPNARLVIVGDGPLYDELKNRARKLGLLGKVFFTKEINHAELPKYYSAADLFVLPSTIDTIGNVETQGVVLLEAMASKCFVIGTNTGGIPDVISSENVGILVKNNESDMLAKKIIVVLSDSALRKRIAENAYRYVISNFSWKMIAKKYVLEFKRIIMNN